MSAVKYVIVITNTKSMIKFPFKKYTQIKNTKERYRIILTNVNGLRINNFKNTLHYL